MKISNLIFSLLILSLFNNIALAGSSTFSSGGSGSGGEEQVPSDPMSKMKNYIIKGNVLVNEFNNLMDRYENNLKSFSDHKTSCIERQNELRGLGGAWEQSIISTPCSNSTLSVLVEKLRTNAIELDKAEYQIIDLKAKIKLAQGTLYSAEEVKNISSEADAIRAQLISAQQRGNALNTTMN